MPHLRHHAFTRHSLPEFNAEAWLGSFVILLLVATIAALVAGRRLPGF